MRPEIEDFYRPGPGCGDNDMLQLGLYCFARQYFTDSKRYIQGLSLLYEKQGSTFLRELKASPAKIHMTLPILSAVANGVDLSCSKAKVSRH